MHAFEVLADPVRRRVVEVLAHGEQPAGAIVGVIGGEFGISQPAVSRQLGILRDAGFAEVRTDGARRIYSVDATALDRTQVALDRLRAPLRQSLDALHTEIARGKRSQAADAAAPVSPRARKDAS